MSREALLPWFATYHNGPRVGAAAFFAENPDMLAWSKAEIARLTPLPRRGMPAQDDFVSKVHRDALERMVAEYEKVSE